MNSLRYDMQEINRARLAKGWTWGELAKRAGLSLATGTNLNAGRGARPSTVKALAKALGLKLDDLIIPTEATATNPEEAAA